MPHLDTLTYSSQLFWFLFGFIILWIYNSNYMIPVMESLNFFRKLFKGKTEDNLKNKMAIIIAKRTGYSLMKTEHSFNDLSDMIHKGYRNSLKTLEESAERAYGTDKLSKYHMRGKFSGIINLEKWKEEQLAYDIACKWQKEELNRLEVWDNKIVVKLTAKLIQRTCCMLDILINPHIETSDGIPDINIKAIDNDKFLSDTLSMNNKRNKDAKTN